MIFFVGAKTGSLASQARCDDFLHFASKALRDDEPRGPRSHFLQLTIQALPDGKAFIVCGKTGSLSKKALRDNDPFRVLITVIQKTRLLAKRLQSRFAERQGVFLHFASKALRDNEPWVPRSHFLQLTIKAFPSGKAFIVCGKTGIRTLGTRKGTTVFETVPIDHSGIFPRFL